MSGSQRDLNSDPRALSGSPPSPAVGARVSRGREGRTRAPHAAPSPAHVPRRLFGFVSLDFLETRVVDAEQSGLFAWKQLYLCFPTTFMLLKHAREQKWGSPATQLYKVLIFDSLPFMNIYFKGL